MDDPASALRGILGSAIDQDEASRLLERAGGSVEAAVGAFFHSQEPVAPADASSSPRTSLRAVIGPEATEEQIAVLMSSAGGSVDAAAELFFASGLPAVGDATELSRQREHGTPRGQQQPRRPRQAAVRARDAITRELQATDAPPPSRPAVSFAGPSTAPVPTQPRSRMRRAPRQQLPEVEEAEDDSSETSTDGSSTGSEAVTDEGSDEAPDSASDGGGGSDVEEIEQEAVAQPRQAVDEDVWEPTEEMLAEYEAAQEAAGHGGQRGNARSRQNRSRRRSAQAARVYFEAVARMADMVVPVDSSDDEAEQPAAPDQAGSSVARLSRARRAAKPEVAPPLTEGASAGEQMLLDPKLPLPEPLQRAALLNVEALCASQRATEDPKQSLPFAKWRNKAGQLFAPPEATGLPAQETVSPDAMKFPILLGTFNLDLGQVKEPIPATLKAGCKHRIEFCAQQVLKTATAWEWKRVQLRYPNRYRLDDICNGAIMEVFNQELGTKGKGEERLCSIGGYRHPLADLFGALSYLKGHSVIKMRSKIEVTEEGGDSPARVVLELAVLLTNKGLTFDEPFDSDAMQYESSRVKYGASGAKEIGETLRIIFHHLLAHGSGFSLGRDSDGVLNFMDSKLPALKTGASTEHVLSAKAVDRDFSIRETSQAVGSAERPVNMPAEALTQGFSAEEPNNDNSRGPDQAVEFGVEQVKGEFNGDPIASFPRSRRPSHSVAANLEAEAGSEQPAQPLSRLGRNTAPQSIRRRENAKLEYADPDIPETRHSRLTRANASFASLVGSSENEVLPESTASGQIATEQLDEEQAEQRHAEESDIGRMMQSGALDPAYPAADQPEELQTQAKGWQLQGLAWMLDRELTGDPLKRGGLLLHPCWLQFQTQDGQLLYMHRLQPHYVSTNFYAAPSGGTCGGFLADVMGLGKTLQIIMLALKNPAPAGWAIDSFDEAKGASWKPGWKPGEKPQLSLKTTLIVVPNNLRAQWLEELRKHVKPGALKWCTYSSRDSLEAAQTSPRAAELTELLGFNEKNELVPLHECDIAVVTYEALMDELRRVKWAPLLQWGYWRLCLDEAQLVSRTNTQAAAAVSDIYRRHAWVVTGTPITSKAQEIQGLLAFLDLDPFYQSRPWTQLLDKDTNNAGTKALLPLCSLLRGVMLRRRKEDVGPDLALPPCAHEDWWLDLSKVERAVYDGKRKEMQSAVEQYIQARSSADANIRRHLNRCRKLLTDLRQASCDPQMVRAKTEVSTSQRRSMQTIMMDLVVKAFQSYDATLRSALQAKLLAEAFCSKRPGEAAASVVAEMKHALVSNSKTQISELMAGRKDDGMLELPKEDISEAVQSGLASLQHEVDEFGEQVLWQTSFRRKKRKAREEAGLQPPLEAGPDPRQKWRSEDELPEADGATANADFDHPTDESGAVVEGEAPGQGRGRKRQKTEKKEKTREEKAAERLAKKAADKERAARREATRKRNAERQAEYEAWIEQQAPPPLSEADIAEEEAARAAQNRVRSWAKALLDANEVLVDILQHSQESGEQLDVDASLAGSSRSSLATTDPLQTVRSEMSTLRRVLGEEAAVAAVGEEPRFSKRKRALEPEQQMQEQQYQALLQAHAAKERANNLMLVEMDKLRSRKQPDRIVKKALAVELQQLRESWGSVRRQTLLQEEVLAKEKGKVVAAPAPRKQGDEDAIEQEDIYTCPICCDLADRRTVTTCGHFFCSDCLTRALAIKSICPLCRKLLSPADLFDAFTPDEAADAERQQEHSVRGDFSTKVNAVVAEVLKMRAQGKGSKAVVFSTWTRLLKVVSAALQQSRVPHVSLAAAVGDRSSNLETFQTDPDCSVLLVVLSTLGGAAGLTLVVADTVILMEPSLWPGLEAQAAGRIHRLGQTKETRMIRLLARQTIDDSILKEQARKMSARSAGDAIMADVDPGTILSLLESHPQGGG